MKLTELNFAELPFNARRLINQAKAISAILEADGRRFCQEVLALHESGNLDKLFSELSIEEANHARVLACAFSKTHEFITGEALIDINALADHLDGEMRFDEDDIDLNPAPSGKLNPHSTPDAGGESSAPPQGGASIPPQPTPPTDPVSSTGDGQTVPLITPTLGPSGGVVISDETGQSAGADAAASDTPSESAQAPEAAAAEAPAEAAHKSGNRRSNKPAK